MSAPQHLPVGREAGYPDPDPGRSLTERPRHPVLSFERAGLTFPTGTTALKDIDFDVLPGEFVTVVGPSGCGKSTLLRVASGLQTITDGDVRVATEKIGYVFQDATLLPWRSVRRNVELLAEIAGVPAAERAQRAADAIDLVGLTGFEQHYPRALSGGMRMRVSLARSLVRDPQLFLFDEPFGALDEITRERLNDELSSIFSLRRFTGLFITHSVAEAVYLGTRVIVMSGRPGTIRADIRIPESHPRDPDFRFSKEFAEVTSQVAHHLREGHSA
ncbi:ABC transporter ATP-binding protein [Herbiconiux ginsengi]|uniref:NitT/TauT family transport system ATP-binding protein n=1 Tax=Herbiconiux ginsengi TaxID=381665 RepID=A0A1H3S081_9MICO|nr:ABC transporter ATP-binding protein [Herbiconiux ginsengi]SDZ31443.1 NitT/TauT family transport system ATP-binding protein [Herbiconiux ginsengi]